MTKKPCDGCPENKCRKCPVAEEIEQAVLKSQANFGLPEIMHIPHPDTGEFVYVDTKNPSPEALEVLDIMYKNMKVSVKVDQ